MNLDFTDEEIAFRAEARAFIANCYPAHLRRIQEEGRTLERDDYLAWHRVLAARGWAAPDWPAQYGGTGWSATRRYIWSQEQALAETLRPLPFGLQMVGPVIYTFGTPEQKARFLPPTLAADIWWCQGYSEPGSGSDLASLRTRAVRDGDYYVVNGQKTWTTMAHYADWGFFLVRTDPDAKPQAGISFLLIDMKTPGITVRPIIGMDGKHEVNEVWLQDVRVPLENRVFHENQGWTCAKFLLGHERVSIAEVAASKRGLSRLRMMASSIRQGGKPLSHDPFFIRKLSELEIDLMALEYTELRMLVSESAGKAPGPGASLLKIKGVEIQQRLTELSAEAVGQHGRPHAPLHQGDNAPRLLAEYARGKTDHYFNTRKTSIYGGSNEIQRNIIAKAVLDL